MTSEAARLKEHLRRVGEAKKASHEEATAAHLALPAGERFARGVQLSDSTLRLHKDARLAGTSPTSVDVEADTWSRVNQHLRRLSEGGGATNG